MFPEHTPIQRFMCLNVGHSCFGPPSRTANPRPAVALGGTIWLNRNNDASRRRLHSQRGNADVTLGQPSLCAMHNDPIQWRDVPGQRWPCRGDAVPGTGTLNFGAAPSIAAAAPEMQVPDGIKVSNTGTINNHTASNYVAGVRLEQRRGGLDWRRPDIGHDDPERQRQLQWQCDQRAVSCNSATTRRPAMATNPIVTGLDAAHKARWPLAARYLYPYQRHHRHRWRGGGRSARRSDGHQ